MDTYREIIETAISENTCLKNFKCYYNNFEGLCKTRCIDNWKTLLECIDDGSDTCEYPFYFEGKRCCGCKVRAVIALELGI